MDRDDVIERLAIAIYFAYVDLIGVKGARWDAVDPRSKDVWRVRAIEACRP